MAKNDEEDRDELNGPKMTTATRDNVPEVQKEDEWKEDSRRDRLCNKITSINIIITTTVLVYCTSNGMNITELWQIQIYKYIPYRYK